MITTMADLSGLLRRVGMARSKVSVTVLRSASELALLTLCGSSMMTRSPRDPVIEVMAMACRKPLAVVSNLVLAFWSPVNVTRSPQRS